MKKIENLRHCYLLVAGIASYGAMRRSDLGDPEVTAKQILQVGYNLGRISELTGEGRDIWDLTKNRVEEGDWEALRAWAQSRLNDLPEVVWGGDR